MRDVESKSKYRLTGFRPVILEEASDTVPVGPMNDDDDVDIVWDCCWEGGCVNVYPTFCPMPTSEDETVGTAVP